MNKTVTGLDADKPEDTYNFDTYERPGIMERIDNVTDKAYDILEQIRKAVKKHRSKSKPEPDIDIEEPSMEELIEPGLTDEDPEHLDDKEWFRLMARRKI